MQILVEVLHVKNLSLLVKDDVLYILQHLLLYYGEWVCDVIEKGMDGIHSKFH